MDILTKKQRSAHMSRIRGKDTKPELVVRRMLRSMGFRFTLHDKKLPGTPDIVLPKRRRAILVHGCFFHSHTGCRLAYKPKTRRALWRAKFIRNVARDAAVRKALKTAGWRVTVIWECETRKPNKLLRRLNRILSYKT
jgi:DNA mismatch endonuclease (patch repair protein)